MNWQQSRRHYPGQWLLIEALQAHTQADRRIVEDVAVVGIYDDSPTALDAYKRLHRTAPERELYVAHADRDDLDIVERRWLGVRQSL